MYTWVVLYFYWYSIMIRHRWILVIAALLVSWPVVAQEEPGHTFYPLGIGDTWEYEVAYGDRYEPVDLVSYQRRTVLRDTLIDGDVYRLVRVDSVSAEPGYEVLAEALCAVRVTEAGRVESVAVEEAEGETCWLPEASLEMGIGGEDASRDVFINGEPYEFDVVRVEEGEGLDRKLASTAEGFGLLQWIQPEWEETGYPDKYVLRVIYAEVGSEAYGHSIGSDVWRAFYPLGEGDIREYEREWTGPEGGTFRNYERWEVGTDTTIGGLAYALVRQREYDDQYDLVEERTCALRVTEDGRVEAQLVGGAEQCSTFVSGAWDLRTNTWTVRRSSWLGATALAKQYRQYDEYTSLRMDVVAGLGVVETYWASNCCGPQSTRGGSGWELKFAIADGMIYGSPLTPDQPSPGHAFYPLGIGDTWEYEVAARQSIDPYGLGSYERRTVLRDTLLDGEVYRLVRKDSISAEPGHEVLAEALCAVRVREAGFVDWVAADLSGGGTCWVPEVAQGLVLGSGEQTQDEVYINGAPYAFGAVRVIEDENSPANSFTTASGFGIVTWQGWLERYPVGDKSRVYKAIYASVGGEEYGHTIGSEAWEAYYPLSEGDVRVYERSGRGPQGGSTRGYLRWDVGRDTTISGLAYTTVRQRSYSGDGGLTDEGYCALRLTEDGAVDAVRIGAGGTCGSLVRSTWDLRSNTWTEQAVEVLGVSTTGKLYRIDNESNTIVLSVARGIGVTETYYSDNAHGSGGAGGSTLKYVVVDGVIYGTLPTDLPGDAPTPLALTSTYPNPFRSMLTVTLSSRLASADIVLEVFDVLGRRVLRRDLGEQTPGDTPHTINAASWAPGVYFIRATTDSGESAVYRVAKVD